MKERERKKERKGREGGEREGEIVYVTSVQKMIFSLSSQREAGRLIWMIWRDRLMTTQPPSLSTTPAIPVGLSTPVNTCWTSWLWQRRSECLSSLMKSTLEWYVVIIIHALLCTYISEDSNDMG